MQAMAEGLIALSFALCVLMIPIWLYTKLFKKTFIKTAENPEDEKRKIEELLNLADTMEKRIQTLEAILDKQHPNWRYEL